MKVDNFVFRETCEKVKTFSYEKKERKGKRGTKESSTVVVVVNLRAFKRLPRNLFFPKIPETKTILIFPRESYHDGVHGSQVRLDKHLIEKVPL